MPTRRAEMVAASATISWPVSQAGWPDTHLLGTAESHAMQNWLKCGPRAKVTHSYSSSVTQGKGAKTPFHWGGFSGSLNAHRIQLSLFWCLWSHGYYRLRIGLSYQWRDRVSISSVKEREAWLLDLRYLYYQDEVCSLAEELMPWMQKVPGSIHGLWEIPSWNPGQPLATSVDNTDGSMVWLGIVTWLMCMLTYSNSYSYNIFGEGTSGQYQALEWSL